MVNMMFERFQGQGQTQGREFHPVIGLASLLVLGGGLLIFSHPLFLAVLFAGVLVLGRAAGASGAFRIVLLYGWGMMLFLALMNVIFNTGGGTVLWTGPRFPVIGRLNVTAEELWYSLSMGLRLLGMILLFIAYERMLSPDQMLALFGKRGGYWLVTVFLTMRLFPLCVAEGRRILRFQACRGVAAAKGWSGIASLRPVFAAWLLSTLERAWWMAESMAARGYGSGRRSVYGTVRMSRHDWRRLGLLATIAIVMALLRWPLAAGVFRLSPEMMLSWQIGEWAGAFLLAALTGGVIVIVKGGSRRAAV
jgi:energy-coupling factor transport system permease protein